jgi:hypothetical protein
MRNILLGTGDAYEHHNNTYRGHRWSGLRQPAAFVLDQKLFD